VVLLLRALAVTLVAVVMIAALAAKPRKDQHERTLDQKAALVNVALSRDMFRFDTGEETDVSRLLRAGLITPEDAL
jgi:flagellar basal body-associated protein FliL